MIFFICPICSKITIEIIAFSYLYLFQTIFFRIFKCMFNIVISSVSDWSSFTFNMQLILFHNLCQYFWCHLILFGIFTFNEFFYFLRYMSLLLASCKCFTRILQLCLGSVFRFGSCSLYILASETSFTCLSILF